jgi:hypothetical protein
MNQRIIYPNDDGGVDAQQAEGARQAIREKYAALQVQMDLAQTPEELKALLPQE